jgi:hypothetical protein
LDNIHEVNMTRNSCKLILVLVACAVPLVAAIVNAEQNDRTVGPSEAVRAGAVNNAAAAPQPGNGQAINGLGAEEGPSSSLDTPDTAEHGWIVVLALAALATSLAAAGYVVWQRSQSVPGTMTVLMPQTADRNATAPTPERQARPERRAA